MKKQQENEKLLQVPLEEMTVAQRVGYNIYCARKALEMERVALAKRLGIKRQSVIQQEAGEVKRLNFELIVELCQVLKIDLDYLFTGTKATELKMDHKYKSLFNDPQAIQLLKVFHKIETKKDRQLLIAWLKQVVKDGKFPENPKPRKPKT